MAFKLSDDEIKKLDSLLNVAINLKKERQKLRIVDEFRQVEEKDLTHTFDKTKEIDLGFKYEEQVKPSNYTLQVNEKWGGNILGSGVSTKDPHAKGQVIDGNLIVMVPVKKLIRKKTKEALQKLEEAIWDEIDTLVAKVVKYEDLTLIP